MKWPRGRYNGWRIIGIEFKFVLDVTSWRWLPIIGNHCGMFHWLCFRTWTQWHYDQREKRQPCVPAKVDQ